MSFDLARTPTLHAVATGDDQQLIEDLQQRVDAAMRQAEEAPAVIEAAESQRQAEQHLVKLQKAERALNQFAKETGEKLAASMCLLALVADIAPKSGCGSELHEPTPCRSIVPKPSINIIRPTV